MRVTQFLQQLLPVAAAIKDVIGEYDVETLGMYLAECLSRICSSKYINETQRVECCA